MVKPLSHLLPLKCLGQSHLKWFFPFGSHTPLFIQGFGLHLPEKEGNSHYKYIIQYLGNSVTGGLSMVKYCL